MTQYSILSEVNASDVTYWHLDSDSKHFVTCVEVKSELRYTIKHI